MKVKTLKSLKNNKSQKKMSNNDLTKICGGKHYGSGIWMIHGSEDEVLSHG